MRKSACLAVIISAFPLLMLNTPAVAKKFSGNYSVTLVGDAKRAGLQCYTFTNTGEVSGHPNSGTWTNGFTDYGGYFVVDHGKLHFYGEDGLPTLLGSMDVSLATGKGSWVNFYFTDYILTPGSVGTVTMTPGC